ncbi:MAG: M14 family metallopeptidase, partial [Bacteroidetes bacterium]|nr:M14 family metallopeptidase [Bacteroidota bacterium]
MPIPRSLLIPVLFLTTVLPAFAQQGWLTDFERSGSVASPNYERTLRYLQRLDSASEWIRLESFGVTPQGRDLPLVILARGGEFTPEAARASGKEIILIQSGIHAGEIDGKDASLILLREIAVTRSLEELADSAVILFMPIFNLDGHERSSPFNRINQNGPAEMGWRTTAQNLNLNRDYMKADAPEMRAWLRAFNAWMPDMLVDCHVTDGIDFRYTLSYAMEMHGNMAAPVVAWQRALEQAFIAGMESAGDPVVPYTFPRERSDIRQGIIDWASRPRLSTGYAAVRNRANLLIETHMMKPYKDRVLSTYRLLIEVLRYVKEHPGTLRTAVRTAEQTDIARFTRGDDSLAVHFRSEGSTRLFRFRGYETEIRKSDISGGEYVWWDHAKPIDVEIPFYDDVRPAVKVLPPRYYIIPQEWGDVIAVLRLHGVRLQRLERDAQVPVQSYVFSNPRWRDTPYEGRFTVEADRRVRQDTMSYRAGDVVVDLAQPSGRVAVHLLEPDAPDSFVLWGFFNAIF